MQNAKLQNSVANLVNLYTVVIGTALAIALAGVIDMNLGLRSVTIDSFLLFVAFLVTMVPFFQGALRHLHDAYMEGDGAHASNGALIIDFLLLFTHGIAFVALALLLRSPVDFAWALCAILFIDVVWGVWARHATKAEEPGRWAFINSLFVFSVGPGLVVFDLTPAVVIPDPTKLVIVITALCFIRTTVDYFWCHSFYFPKA